MNDNNKPKTKSIIIEHDEVSPTSVSPVTIWVCLFGLLYFFLPVIGITTLKKTLGITIGILAPLVFYIEVRNFFGRW